MKKLRREIIELLKAGNCTPRISTIASKLHSRSSTIHYNIKQLEKESAIRSYRAVFDYKKIDEGFCSFVLISLASGSYKDPDKIAEILSKYPQVESVDIITGRWELIIKVRTANMDEYYEFAKNLVAIGGVDKTETLNSIRQVKSEFTRAIN
ncbi:MAG: Lrp/AsnC family transcriptional regulator [Candidatus Micrarchaeota archaeon]|nr:Lrp/AsnC family transcriptional regulator [Candidatus Micrarchaeota archaeon]